MYKLFISATWISSTLPEKRSLGYGRSWTDRRVDPIHLPSRTPSLAVDPKCRVRGRSTECVANASLLQDLSHPRIVAPPPPPSSVSRQGCRRWTHWRGEKYPRFISFRHDFDVFGNFHIYSKGPSWSSAWQLGGREGKYYCTNGTELSALESYLWSKPVASKDSPQLHLIHRSFYCPNLFIIPVNPNSPTYHSIHSTDSHI